METTELYRICMKSSNFKEPPTFRIKIGKTEKKINPYFIQSDKQRYNCDSILERKNQAPQCIISCFIGYKFVGSGSLQFKQAEMPNQKIQIFNRDKESIAFIDLSMMKIDKVIQIPALKLEISTGKYDDVPDLKNPYLVLKYGELNYQTKVFQGNTQQINWNQTFKCPQSEMQRILVQSWCEKEGQQRFLGVSIVPIKHILNTETEYDVYYLSKSRGKIKIGVIQDKQNEAKLRDYSNAIKRTIKVTAIEAVMMNTMKKGGYLKLLIGPQVFETTPIYNQLKQLNWNQAFTAQVNSEKEELVVKLCIKQNSQEEIGRSFLEISRICNRRYELTILNEQEQEEGKVYIQFYDHELDVKEITKKTIPKQLADKIASDMEAIKNRYRKKDPIHEYMQNLHAVLEEGMVKVAKAKPKNPIRELGQFLLNYKK